MRKKPLHHDRDVDDLHDLHNGGVDHPVQEQLGKGHGHKDHGDDLDELQLRNFRSFLHINVPNRDIDHLATNCNWGNTMNC